jgi:hypothetical protein
MHGFDRLMEDVVEVSGLVGASALALVQASRKSGGSKDTTLLLITCGGFLIFAVRLGSKIFMRRRKPSMGPPGSYAFPTVALLRAMRRHYLASEPFPGPHRSDAW